MTPQAGDYFCHKKVLAVKGKLVSFFWQVCVHPERKYLGFKGGSAVAGLHPPARGIYPHEPPQLQGLMGIYPSCQHSLWHTSVLLSCRRSLGVLILIVIMYSDGTCVFWWYFKRILQWYMCTWVLHQPTSSGHHFLITSGVHFDQTTHFICNLIDWWTDRLID